MSPVDESAPTVQPPASAAARPPRRLRIFVQGAVQGVGFRPFVQRLAASLGIQGSVRNTAQGVIIEAQAEPARLDQFLRALRDEKPPAALLESIETAETPWLAQSGFAILPSERAGVVSAVVLPDLAACADCLREIFDPADRRHLYPFTNCTNCGPRFSIIRSLPYDRTNTTMASFAMCEACRAEYEDPANRRYHAQPNACPKCGPRLELWDFAGVPQAREREALLAAAEALRRGQIVAVKGLGGFHLMVDARDDEAVRRLRLRKHREEKPFALMAPSVEWIEAHCETGEEEKRILLSPQAPIMLLRRRREVPQGSAAADSVAPHNPNLGVMLPYTPLHHILMRELGFPVVATSGNLSEEPICTDEAEALRRLGSIADAFLVHNRPIERHVDDSIVRIAAGEVQILRRSRGYAPLPLHLPGPAAPMLAVGGHLKNTIAVCVERHVFISQHIGDLDTEETYQAFVRTIRDFRRLYQLNPALAVCDLHPDYLSTRYAERSGLPVMHVQHHAAHVMSCMAERGIEPPVLGVAWDGTGYGEDGTVWGGEFFRVAPKGWERVAHLRTFPLPGGPAAVQEPRRSALGALYELYGDEAFAMEDLAPLRAFSPTERRAMRFLLSNGVNSPRTSSAGRLFDAVASCLDLCQRSRFEGQAAMRVEFAIGPQPAADEYPFAFQNSGPNSPLRLDWAPAIEALLSDLRRGESAERIAARFHNTLVAMIVDVARRIGERRVALSGGCFQNRYLLEQSVRRLAAEGFEPHWPRRTPCNDGGLALGQLWAAAWIAAGKDV